MLPSLKLSSTVKHNEMSVQHAMQCNAAFSTDGVTVFAWSMNYPLRTVLSHLMLHVWCLMLQSYLNDTMVIDAVCSKIDIHLPIFHCLSWHKDNFHCCWESLSHWVWVFRLTEHSSPSSMAYLDSETVTKIRSPQWWWNASQADNYDLRNQALDGEES